MSEILNDVNASQEGIVDLQNASAEGDVQTGEGTQSETGGEVAEPDKKVQTPEENSAFKEMRLRLEALEAEKQQAQRDAIYAKKYPDLEVATEAELKALYGDQGINSYEDLDRYYENLAKAEEMEVSPKVLETLEQMQERINALEKEKTDLQNGQEIEKVKAEMTELYGDIFTQHEKEIMDLAERMNMKNASGIRASVATVIADQFPKIMKDMNEKLAKAKEDGVKEYVESKKNEIPVEGSGVAPSNVGSKPKNPWEEARKNSLLALRGN